MRYISYREFCERHDLSLSTLKRREKEDPRFPKKVRLSAQRVGFREDDVEVYLSALAEPEAA
jgi:predicted DNA-binding transcriptional regulator AlpA